MAADGLHQAEHRSYRELAAVVRQMLEHWAQLGWWLPASQGAAEMTAGADLARRLLADLETHLQRYDVSIRPASQALGGGLGLVRRQVADRFLERNQALRTAALEAHHVTMLLDFLAHVARARADHTAQQFCERWRQETASIAEQASRAAAHLGDEPELAIAPVDPSTLGRAAHRAVETAGAFGEFVDRQVAQAQARRKARRTSGDETTPLK
jgi:hypothetical protein